MAHKQKLPHKNCVFIASDGHINGEIERQRDRQRGGRETETDNSALLFLNLHYPHIAETAN